jgi:hypothetical protein
MKQKRTLGRAPNFRPIKIQRQKGTWCASGAQLFAFGRMMRLLRNSRQQCAEQTQGNAKRAFNHGGIHI